MDPIPPQKSVTELTAERIREAIILGTFPLGTKLSEQKLADQLQISRSPVREALVLLQIEGLVRVSPKRGSFVFSPDDRTIRDLCEHRDILETACLALAMERDHGGLLRGLQAGMEQMQDAIRTSDTEQYSRGDIRFHRAIIASSQNNSMIKVYESTIGPLMALRTHLFTISGIHLDRSMEEHAELLDACSTKDIARAQAICTRHIHHLVEHVHEERNLLG
ncbi:DNA-binding transcriptional regulator, GntR family [Poseidonocella pacifica]|uniref:DNA-binding transcriptional regulator, GntR family n=1 Tax=Poseidonocella pacifica TaxID=871651 RepID=A0A1I0UY60_9RHOB|nr:GntR family transcriptional regulator [Poseidonocella pacifica]SFA68823.1 DNA-binding transcriptional regulator, GntR family [Poseidonocella pacifica]